MNKVKTNPLYSRLESDPNATYEIVSLDFRWTLEPEAELF